jgi:hypothetical protein
MIVTIERRALALSCASFYRIYHKIFRCESEKLLIFLAQQIYHPCGVSITLTQQGKSSLVILIPVVPKLRPGPRFSKSVFDR